MKSKSCLVQMIIFIVAVAIVGGVARRVLDRWPAAQQRPRASIDSLRQFLQMPILDAVSGKSAPSEATPTWPAMPEPEAEGIKGLVLELSRPLMFPIPDPRGMAATESFFYITGANAAQKTGTLYQVHRDTYTIAQMRTIAEGDHYRPGGLHMGAELLWVALRAEAPVTTSVILGIDPLYLEVQTRFVVPERITAIAEGPGDRLYGINEDSSLIYTWNQAGEELGRASLVTGADYGDMEVARGSLLCAGVDESDRSVLDVIDPITLSLLVRHQSDASETQNEPLAGAGFAVLDETLFFLPNGGDFPKIHTYVLASDRDWASMMPSVSP